jgi:hypothetical protein
MKKLIILLSMLLATAVLAGETVIEDGVTIIRNGAQPSGGVETMKLKELWRAGGEDDEVFFGLITQVVVDDAGNIYLLDTQLSEVKVYSPEGENIATLSREGDGPGEIRTPVDMFFTPEGNLGLMQTFPGKVVIIDLEGNPVGNYTPGGTDPTQGGFLVLQDAESFGDQYLVCGISIAQAQTGQIRTSFLSAFDAEGTQQTVYLEKKDEWDFSNFSLDEKDQYFVNFRRWTVGPDGRIYGAPERNDYRVHVFNPDGTPDRIIEREYEPLERDEDGMAFINNAMAAAARQFPFEIQTSVESTEPDFGSMEVRGDGSLWVSTSRGVRNQDEGIISTYDVFDKEGHFTKQVKIAAQGDGAEDGLIFAGDDRVVIITGFMDAVLALQGGGGAAEEEEEPEPMEIICYAID